LHLSYVHAEEGTSFTQWVDRLVASAAAAARVAAARAPPPAAA
jgi:hypothetical protein